MKEIILKYYTFLPLLLLCIFYGYQSIEFPIHDFANYYFGGKFLADGHFNSNIYFPYQFNKAISDLGNLNIFASYAPNTPFLAFFFLPFSWVSLATAKLLFNGISIVLFVFSIFRLFSFYTINPKWALLIPILFLVPIKNNLLFGQVYFLLFFLLAEGWLAYEKKQLKQMALFWSIAILLKVFPALLIVFLLFRKQWKALAYLTVSGLLLFGVSIVLTGIDIWGFYLKEVLPKASNGEIATSFVDNYQSVFMFLKRLFIYENVENPHPFFHSDSLFFALFFAFKMGVLLLDYFISKRNFNVFFVFAYWILGMILLSPYGSTYTFLLMLFPFLGLVNSTVTNVKKVVCFLILLLINNLPLSLFMDNAFPFSYIRLFLLVAFTGVFVIVLFQQSVLLKAFVFGCIVFVIGTFFAQPAPQRSESFLTVGSPILIHDYEIKGNQLTYFYWNEKGENKTSIPFKSLSVSKLDIKENQIVSEYKILTSDASHKYKPILINNKAILYLSDYDRGIGFYKLRVIKLK